MRFTHSKYVPFSNTKWFAVKWIECCSKVNVQMLVLFIGILARARQFSYTGFPV
nr:hypothetical protein [uncultured Sediminibacterium sp.]